MTDISSLLILALLVLAQNRKQPVLATKVEANHETKNCTLQQSLWIKMDGLSNTGTTERVGADRFNPRDIIDQGKSTRDIIDQEFALRILVLTYRRAKFLTRLLQSLIEADYDHDVVALDIFIDR